MMSQFKVRASSDVGASINDGIMLLVEMLDANDLIHTQNNEIPWSLNDYIYTMLPSV